MSSINQILQDALHLSEDQRLTLVHKLLMVSEPQASENVEQAWDMEIRDRIARYDRGELCSRPVGEIFSEIDRRLNS